MPFEKVQLEKNNQKAFHDLCDACDKMREAYHALRASQGHEAGMIQLAFKSDKNHWVLHELTSEEFQEWRSLQGVPEHSG